MAYSIVDPILGAQAIADTSTTQRHPAGLIVSGQDPTLGGAEFIYLKGVASTVVGSVVSYNTTSFTTALGITTRRIPRPIGVSMSANVANQWGWYQISGVATAKKATATSFAANAAVAVLTTGTGLVVATATGKEIQGALVAAVSSGIAANVLFNIVLNRPHIQGRIT